LGGSGRIAHLSESPQKQGVDTAKAVPFPILLFPVVLFAQKLAQKNVTEWDATGFRSFLLWSGISATSAKKDLEAQLSHIKDDQDVDDENAPAKPVGVTNNGEDLPREVKGTRKESEPFSPIAFMPQAVCFSEADSSIGDDAEGEDP
jgi:hypothetical protein